jgi:hypothetical protein
MTLPASALERILTRRLVIEDDDEDDDAAVTYGIRHDAHWLKCYTTGVPLVTLLGILEDKREDLTIHCHVYQLLPVQLLLLPNATSRRGKEENGENTTTTTTTTNNDIGKPQSSSSSLRVVPPKSEWSLDKKANLATTETIQQRESTSTTIKKTSLNLQWIDLRDSTTTTTTTTTLSLKTSGDCYTMLQSILGSDHDSSPWVLPSSTDDDDDDSVKKFDICVLALPSSHNIKDNAALPDFRVSDAAPSWFLHAMVHCDALESNGGCFTNQIPGAGGGDDAPPPATLYIYKRLPSRPGFSVQAPPSPPPPGCLWETVMPGDNGETNDKDGKDNNNIPPEEETTTTPIITRLQCPPYLNLAQVYPPHVHQQLLSTQALQVFTQEALSIPQWTPWPETQHYSSSVDDDGQTTPTWTVFPLCYCFPSNDVSKRTWVDQTRTFCPKTCELLERTLGPLLRTALFSRLKPNTTLAAHTGWADLANHVLRLHIPLVVPTTTTTTTTPLSLVGSCCGTWVDGCVEMHSEGRPILFDDSKIHRAFNYSQEQERIVLIVDMERPESLPVGYATGGHSEELDAFIQQMNVPK